MLRLYVHPNYYTVAHHSNNITLITVSVRESHVMHAGDVVSIMICRLILYIHLGTLRNPPNAAHNIPNEKHSMVAINFHPLKMQEIPRTSLDTLQESEEPFLKDPEALQQYNLGNSTYFPWAVPWVFCLLLLIGNAIQARESGLFGPPPKYYWSARELGKYQLTS